MTIASLMRDDSSATGTRRRGGALRFRDVVPGLILYIGGVVVGLFSTDARPAARLGLALLWPVAPLAFVATIACCWWPRRLRFRPSG